MLHDIRKFLHNSHLVVIFEKRGNPFWRSFFKPVNFAKNNSFDGQDKGEMFGASIKLIVDDLIYKEVIILTTLKYAN
jgi:hypothetical protein